MHRIHLLKAVGEREIQKVVDDILTKEVWIAGRSDRMLLADAIQEAIHEERSTIEVAAPLLTFPKATEEQWNGTIDHLDTITGTYNLYIGDPFATHYGEHMLKKFSGGPKIAHALRKALGSEYQVTMSVDAYKSPASRFVIVLPKSLGV